jgi:peptidyl-tRNA hydrolase, PTH1 family
MNLSGVAVRKVLARQRAPLEDLLIVYDDFDLPLGRLRLRGEGSAGTHNGMRSIIGELGNQKFARLRVGIGEPVRHDPDRAAIDHVLSRFGAVEKRTLDIVIDAAADAIEDWARDGAYKAANKWNAWTPDVDQDTADDGHGTNASPLAQEDRKPDKDGIVRHSTGWRRLVRRG